MNETKKKPNWQIIKIIKKTTFKTGTDNYFKIIRKKVMCGDIQIMMKKFKNKNSNIFYTVQ